MPVRKYFMPWFKILGGLEVVQDGRALTPSPPKVRRVLALLVLRAGEVVLLDSLMEELWGAHPPKSAITTIQTYIYHLRKMFSEENLETPEGELLVTRLPGYVLRIPSECIDFRVFERRIDAGQDELESGHPELAAATLRQALNLWNGPVLANVSLGTVLEGHVVRLEERRINALQLRIQADLQLGRHSKLVGELRALTAAYPLNEWFHSKLIMALARSGRRSEALHAYQKMRTVLKEELGLDPSPDLQQLQQYVLGASLFGPEYYAPAER
jgi:SARP family transcriptional regulator, regulator of embCAB operon